MTDWSGFIGTVTQAGAAFVSIVGGFLAARIIQSGSERAASRARIVSIKDKRDRLIRSVRLDGSRLLIYHTSAILNRLFLNFPSTPDPEGSRSRTAAAADLYFRLAPAARSEMSNQTEKIVDRISNAIDAAFAELSDMASRDPQIVTISELRSSLPPLEALEDKLYVEVFAKLRNYPRMLGTGADYFQEHLCAGLPHERSISSNDEYLQVAEQWRADRRELDTTSRDLADEKSVHEAAKRPGDVAGAIQILTFSALATVILPLAYMIQEPKIDLRQLVQPWMPGVSHLNLLLFLIAEALLLFIAYLVLLQYGRSRDDLANSDALESTELSPVSIATKILEDVSLPTDASDFPDLFPTQMFNVFNEYLSIRGYTASLAGEAPCTLTLSREDEPNRMFLAETEHDALREAYERIYLEEANPPDPA